MPCAPGGQGLSAPRDPPRGQQHGAPRSRAVTTSTDAREASTGGMRARAASSPAVRVAHAWAPLPQLGV